MKTLAIPIKYKIFLEEHHDVAASFKALELEIHKAGPLDDKTRVLIKIAISIGG